MDARRLEQGGKLMMSGRGRRLGKAFVEDVDSYSWMYCCGKVMTIASNHFILPKLASYRILDTTPLRFFILTFGLSY